MPPLEKYGQQSRCINEIARRPGDPNMPVNLTLYDVALRLVLTLIAGILIGINRTERGRPAGLRTTLLVCLAASISIQTNLLMSTIGKTPESFGVLDLMRLPLGILTGMGFIGGGAILRRGDMVQGITTAATLWLTTVIGLCLGGGQIELGLTAGALTLLVLWGLKRFEQSLNQDLHAVLIVRATVGKITEDTIRIALAESGYRIGSWDVAYKSREGMKQFQVRQVDTAST
jgi:putative Mg2+ transporter-C (MgtC) family protein